MWLGDNLQYRRLFEKVTRKSANQEDELEQNLVFPLKSLMGGEEQQNISFMAKS